MTTLYEMLGVSEDATDDELKRGYRRAAMQAHPDRNVGGETAAHARFQEIKEAYAILSDPAQRKIYDAVYAAEMQRYAQLREEEERLQAQRDAEYARFVSMAMRFAEQGHNRDVVFGVLLGSDCDAELAGRIAGSVVALHTSRQAEAGRQARGGKPGSQEEEGATPAGAAATGREPDSAASSRTKRTEREPRHAPRAAATSADEPAPEAAPGDAGHGAPGERTHANLFSTLWHSMFGLHH